MPLRKVLHFFDTTGQIELVLTKRKGRWIKSKNFKKLGSTEVSGRQKDYFGGPNMNLNGNIRKKIQFAQNSQNKNFEKKFPSKKNLSGFGLGFGLFHNDQHSMREKNSIKKE